MIVLERYLTNAFNSGVLNSCSKYSELKYILNLSWVVNKDTSYLCFINTKTASSSSFIVTSVNSNIFITSSKLKERRPSLS